MPQNHHIHSFVPVSMPFFIVIPPFDSESPHVKSDIFYVYLPSYELAHIRQTTATLPPIGVKSLPSFSFENSTFQDCFHIAAKVTVTPDYTGSGFTHSSLPFLLISEGSNWRLIDLFSYQIDAIAQVILNSTATIITSSYHKEKIIWGLIACWHLLKQRSLAKFNKEILKIKTFPC